MKWDIFHNTEFVFGSIVMSQGDKGVPIGGFLSAQLCVLWGIFRELLLFDDEVEEKRRGGVDSFSEIIKSVEKKWNPPLTPLHFARSGVLTFPQYVVVPKDKGTFNSAGMHGWVEPEAKIFGTIKLCGFPIDLAAVPLWDAHPEGRVGQVLTLAPKSQHKFLMGYFSSVNPSKCIAAELRGLASKPTVLSPSSPDRGVVLLSRYVDNRYITVVDVPLHVISSLVKFLDIFLSALYELPLKWETSPEGYVTWCEASIHMIKDSPKLLMKGVKWQPLYRASCLVGDLELWDRWVDASSSNVEFALKSRVPTLIGKVATLCSSTEATMINLRSIVMGFGYKGYKWRWWWRPLVNTLTRCGFPDCANLQTIKRWFSLGEGMRLPRGGIG